MPLPSSPHLLALPPSLSGHIFLREPFERRETLAAFASLIGVLLVTRPHALFGGDEAFTVQHVARQTGGTGAGGRFVGGSARAAVFVTCLGVAGAAAACE
jgi:drug/metabolite transporter (DMT)-like permease